MDDRTPKEQAKSGLRKALMWLSGMGWLTLAGAGIAIVATPAPPSHVVGWVLLVVAAVILVATVNRWKKIVTGLLAYGAMNCFVSIFSGHVTSNFSVHVSRSQAITATIFLAISAVLCFRFIEHDLRALDRIALFVLVVSLFLQAAKPKLEAIALGIALFSLIIAWAYDRIQQRRDSSHPDHVTV